MADRTAHRMLASRANSQQQDLIRDTARLAESARHLADTAAAGEFAHIAGDAQRLVQYAVDIVRLAARVEGWTEAAGIATDDEVGAEASSSARVVEAAPIVPLPRDPVVWKRLGATLRQDRERQGLSRAALAAMAGTSLGAIENAEGGRVPKARWPHALPRIAHALGWEPGRLQQLLAAEGGEGRG